MTFESSSIVFIRLSALSDNVTVFTTSIHPKLHESCELARSRPAATAVGWMDVSLESATLTYLLAAEGRRSRPEAWTHCY